MRAVRMGVICVLSAALSHLCANPAERLVDLTGEERVRIVWTRSATNVFGFEINHEENQVLVGYDTETGLEDTIVSELSNYQRPLINRTGCYVLYSSRVDTGVHIVDFGGHSAPEKIAHGVAGCLWYDEAAEKEYAFYAVQYEGRSRVAVRRVNIFDPSEDTLVFNQSETLPVNGQWLCVSSDGAQIGCVWGWPACRTYIMETGRQRVSSNGCWTSMPYDTSYRLVHLNVDHTGIIVAKRTGGSTTKTEVPTGVINHGRLASYSVRFFCASRGMNEEGGNEGGYIGLMRLDSALTTVEDTVIVADKPTGAGDGFPDMWCGPTLMTCGSVECQDRESHGQPAHPTGGIDARYETVVTVHTLNGRQLPVPGRGFVADVRSRIRLNGLAIVSLANGENVLLRVSGRR
ncbi:MAG: hypothetical protein GF331_05420 [Chitinivibrionales bacterium]|nr:hypothetical protein [Chitinivibrionales bacterium]